MNKRNSPSFGISLVPIVVLIVSLVTVIVVKGADAVPSASRVILLIAAVVAYILSLLTTKRRFKVVRIGLAKGIMQVLPSIPVLLLIATVSASWMLSGVVPTLIDYGLEVISPPLFLPIACAVCVVVSMLSGSSWTTIATIGIAFMGIGTVMGYDTAWVAGAIISGAYFGDKCSPLSDTTVLASSTCGVDLFTHIKYLMITTIPSLILALGVYAVVGWFTPVIGAAESDGLRECLGRAFNVTPWVLLIPSATIVMICFRVKTVITLMLSTLLGLIGMYLFQPQIVDALMGDNSVFGYVMMTLRVLLVDTSVETHHDLLNSLVETSGVKGMLPTVWLVLCAMVFGGMMLGTGMLSTISRAFTHKLKSVQSTVGATVASGLFFNATTADQYLSIIIGGNIYKNIYKRNELEPRLLSRTLEDSISVTSVLIPWNSCGITQASVLGVPTLVYLPYCLFNILSPIVTIAVAWLGIGIKKIKT